MVGTNLVLSNKLPSVLLIELQTDYKRVLAFEPGVLGENPPLTTLLQLC